METKEVFDKVASKYDIMNDILSFGCCCGTMSS